MTTEAEFDLLRKMGELPQEIAEAAEQYAPHRLIRYVYELASQFHSYYRAERVITEDAAQTQARLALLGGGSHRDSQRAASRWRIRAGADVESLLTAPTGLKRKETGHEPIGPRPAAYA